MCFNIGNGSCICIYDYDWVNCLIWDFYCFVVWLWGCCSFYDYLLLEIVCDLY